MSATARLSWHLSAMLMFVVALLVALLMEPWSAVVHRVVWHGPLWFVHRTHHRERIAVGPPQGFVLNDLLSLAHAPIAIGLCLAGVWRGGDLGQVLLGIGIGMTVYGVAYVVFHDGVMHRRLPLAKFAQLRWVAAWSNAHALHHTRNAAPFGFFASPWLMRNQQRPSTPVTDRL